MQLINKVELKLENHEKCFLICDSDCPLGQLYDYSCVLQSFIIEKMRIAQENFKPKQEQSEPKPE